MCGILQKDNTATEDGLLIGLYLAYNSDTSQHIKFKKTSKRVVTWKEIIVEVFLDSKEIYLVISTDFTKKENPFQSNKVLLKDSNSIILLDHITV